jgi:hypothetical protein
MANYYFYPYIGLTGGADGALDSLDGSLLKDGDAAFVVITSSRTCYIYTLDEDSNAIEDGVNVIAPDSNAGTKRWLRTSSPTDQFDVAFYGATGNGSTDDTVAIQNALNAVKFVTFGDPSKEYKISSNLILDSNHLIDLRGCKITQTVANKPIFKATSKDNVWIFCEGGVLYGEGTWSDAWTGNTTHWDHGICFLGCTRSGIVDPVIKNMAHAGICIKGGNTIKIINPIIEGTHAYSTVLSSGDNFQNGIYITDDVIYGIGDDILILDPDISGVTQGILRENQGSSAGVVDASLAIVSPNIHDIPGQHAFYIQGGKTAVSNPVLSNIALSGFKVQSADSNQAIKGFTCTGVAASDLGGNLFEIACIGSGSTSNLILSGTGDTVAGYGIAVTGKVQNLKADVVVSNVGTAVYCTGAGASDLDITVKAQTVTETGVLITATTATGIKIRPTLRECNAANGTFYGIHINSASAEVDIFDPDITDASGYMVHGLFNTSSGSTVRVHGFARLTGASSTAVRADYPITEWPTEVVLNGATGDFTSLVNVSSSQEMITSVRSTSVSNVTLWGMNLEDESSYTIVADIAGKLAGSAQRAGYITMCIAYRNGGTATIEGSPPEVSVIESASFAGVYSWAVSDNAVFIVVNSASSVNYDWTARVRVTKFVD